MPKPIDLAKLSPDARAEPELCGLCGEPTGRAGKGEDSIYCEVCGAGPFCEVCFAGHADMMMKMKEEIANEHHD